MWSTHFFSLKKDTTDYLRLFCDSQKEWTKAHGDKPHLVVSRTLCMMDVHLYHETLAANFEDELCRWSAQDSD